MYKDKDRQREANRKAKERWKAKKADAAVREALGIPKEGIPSKGIPPNGRRMSKMEYCKCLLCQMALSKFQLPPHAPVVNFENHYSPKPRENRK